MDKWYGAALANISPSTALIGALLTRTTAVIFPAFHILSSYPSFPFLLEQRTFLQLPDTILRTGIIPDGMKGIIEA